MLAVFINHNHNTCPQTFLDTSAAAFELGIYCTLRYGSGRQGGKIYKYMKGLDILSYIKIPQKHGLRAHHSCSYCRKFLN